MRTSNVAEAKAFFRLDPHAVP